MRATESTDSASSGNPQQDLDESSVAYEVYFSESYQHVVEVRVWIKVVQDQPLEIAFAVWTPGSYMIREYSRNIEQLRASAHSGRDAPSSAELVVERIGKNRWSIPGVIGSIVCVRFRLYCREMSVRTNWVERDYAFITGAATFPFVVGRADQPVSLQLHKPRDWQHVATSLCEVTKGPTLVELQAKNFDELVDSPIVCGQLAISEFEIGGKLHSLVTSGADHLWDLDKAAADTQTLVTEHQRFWGDVPYDRYLFLNLLTEGGGGLEHDNCCVLMASRWTMRKRESYLNWLALVSHEFFHVWNVRRLRPAALQSYDYEHEQYLRELWISEGITSYFDDLALVRTGLCTPEEYLQRLSKNILTVQTSPGRFVQSLADASWDAWIKHYRPDENAPNSRISYYLKGAVVAWLLDAQMQRQTAGVQNLDQAMRCAWKKYRKSGFTLDDFNEIVIELAGQSMRNWLQQHILQTVELDYTNALGWFGVRFRPGNEKSKENGGEKTGNVWIGSESTPTEGRLYVRRVLRGSPSNLAGLNVDDELIALDGYRIAPDTWPDRLGAYQPGDELDLLVARRGKLLNLRIRLGRKPDCTWQLEVDPTNADAVANRLRWLSERKA